MQGIVGATPWNALVFLTLYAQTIGMSDAHASMLVSVFLGSTALGGFLGGWLGDLAAAKYPDCGRIAVCQFSVFAGVPLSLILLKVSLSRSQLHKLTGSSLYSCVCATVEMVNQKAVCEQRGQGIAEHILLV